MELNSDKVTVSKSAGALCEFLSDVKNFEQLMPENINKFEVIRDNAFVFGLKGMPEIALEIKEINKPNEVILGAISDKIPFTLTTDIEAINDSTCKAQFLFEGQFSGMMSMMIKSPIKKFIGTLSENLQKI